MFLKIFAVGSVYLSTDYGCSIFKVANLMIDLCLGMCYHNMLA